MFCPTCGTQVRDGARFCPTCGASLDAAPAVTPQPTNEQPAQDPYAQQATGYPQDPYAQQGIVAAPAYNPNPSEIRHMETDRSIVTVVLLSMITCGIYGFYFVYKCAQDMNTMCDDDEETGGLAVYILLSMVTCGLYGIYWEYKLANRLQKNAPAYGMQFEENGTTVIMWRVIGMLLCVIASYYGMYIWINNLNRLSAAYNARFGV